MRDPVGFLLACARIDRTLVEAVTQVEARLRAAEADADRLYGSLAIFVSEHPDPSVEALGALHCHREVVALR